MSYPTTQNRKLIVSPKIHPIVEVLSYYTRRINNRPISAAISSMREQYPESKESIDALIRKAGGPGAAAQRCSLSGRRGAAALLLR